MFKTSIINKISNQVTNQAFFESEQECLSWVTQEERNKSFGNPEQPELKELQDVLITTAVLDPETGEEIEPAVYEQQEVVVRPYAPAEYTIEITDVTVTVSAQQEMSEITAYLQAEDYKVTKFREQQELGIDTDLTIAEYTLLLAQRQSKRTRFRELEVVLGLR